MYAHAEEMKSMVNELVAMVGASTNGKKGDSDTAYLQKKPKIALKASAAAPGKAVKEIAAQKAKEVSPQQVIPLDDADFQDF